MLVAAPGAGAGDEIREERMFDLQGSRPDLVTIIHFISLSCFATVVYKMSVSLYLGGGRNKNKLVVKGQK